MKDVDPRQALQEADGHYLAVTADPRAGGSERAIAGDARRLAREARGADLRQPILGVEFAVQGDRVNIEYAGTSAPVIFSRPTTQNEIDIVAERVWRLAHPYPELDRPDAECAAIWESAKVAALPQLRTLIREQLA